VAPGFIAGTAPVVVTVFNSVQQARASMSFVDNTIDLPRRNFLSSEFGAVSEGSTLIVEIGYLNFLRLIAQSRTGRRNPHMCRKSARFVQSFR